MPRKNQNAKGKFYEVRIQRDNGQTHGVQRQANSHTHAGKRIDGKIKSVRKIQPDDVMRDLSRMKLAPHAEPVIGQKERFDTYTPNWTLDSVIFGHKSH
jgi:hypothetical protein